MRIGIDGSSILPRRTGIGHYTARLLGALAGVDNENEYVVFLNSFRHSLPREPWMDRPNFAVRRGRFPGPALLYSWRFFNRPSVERFVGEVDVFHSPASYVPPQRRGAAVTTVHDLYFLRAPEACEVLGGRYLRATLPRRLRQVRRIIAVSRSTRDDLVELLDIPPERISVVYEGVDKRFRPMPESEVRSAVRSRYGLPESYILFVGTIEPRKNVERLVEAYSIVRSKASDAPPLVIAGGRGKSAGRVERAVEKLRLSDAVVFSGYVANEDLPALYSGAELFVLPSLYEGFGLPVLEAMACGVPVVAADSSSLRELVEGRGILVSPQSAAEIAEGILRGLGDGDLRAECVEKGLRFAREMTWEKCARETLEVYKRAVLD